MLVKGYPSLRVALFFGFSQMKALILVNGELFQPDILRCRIQDEVFDMVLGADRGALHAAALNLTIDAIIGDLDSLSDSEQKIFSKAKFITYLAKKDETDLELALIYARKHGADHIVMVGAMGGRMDMTIGNLLLMTHPSLGSCRVEMWQGKQTGRIIRPPGEEIIGSPGDTVSLMPLYGSASGITTEGLAYPLKDAELRFGSVRGTSNLMENTIAHIQLLDGLLLAVHTNGRA